MARIVSRKTTVLAVLLGGLAWTTAADALQLDAKSKAGDAPKNIILILADDLGFGDVGCQGATKVKTPNIDRLAARGLRFVDGHCSSATCTPSRYAIMTGEYPWRKKGTNILAGDSALILPVDGSTLPAVLKRAGYATACVGKWHLGLGPPKGPIDWNGLIVPGPLEVGFDHSFIIPATGDRVPCVFVEDRRIAGLDPKDPIEVSYRRQVGDEPTGRDHPELLKMKLDQGHDGTIVNGISRIGWMSGGKSARWIDEQIAETLEDKAVAFIEKFKDKPFFLYFASHDIHVPRVPGKPFVGATELGARGDAIAELDATVGKLVATLEHLKLIDDTLIIFTSDNGPVLNDGYADGAVEKLAGHAPAGPFRGGKYTNWEGGTRVPFVVSWPRRIKPGVSDALVCQVDFLVSLAALVGADVPATSRRDGQNILPALLGETSKGRESLVEQASGPETLALRQGNLKFILRPGRIEPGARLNEPRLYDLSRDPGETKDLAPARPNVVRELADTLEKLRRFQN